MRKITSLCIICALLLSTGCSMVSVTSTQDRFEEFTWYKTFTLNDGANMPDNALNKYPQLRDYADEVVKKILIEKGFTYAETGDTDFVVYTYGVLTEVGQSFRDRTWRGTSRGPTVELTQGALIIDIVNTMDVEEKRLTWRGKGERLVNEIAETDDAKKRLEKNITSILADFPPN